jgi:hypothetical protein
LCFHQVERSLDREVIDLLFDLADKLFPDEGRQPREQSVIADPGRFSHPATVVEMAIPLDIEDEMTEDESQLRTAEAFDKGPGFVRRVQQAYCVATRVPVRLVAREALPPLIPHALRRLHDDEGSPVAFQAPAVMYLPNLNMPLHPDGWDDGLNGRFDAAMEHSVAGGFLFSYLDFLREASVAFCRIQVRQCPQRRRAVGIDLRYRRAGAAGGASAEQGVQVFDFDLLVERALSAVG